MNISELLQNGISHELEKRGVAAPDLTASGMMKSASIDGQNLKIDGLPINEYLDKFCETAPQKKADNWQPPTVDQALGDISIYESWLDHDPEGCEREFKKLTDDLEQGICL